MILPSPLSVVEQCHFLTGVRNVGAATARKIAEIYGESTFAMIVDDPQKVADASGVSVVLVEECRRLIKTTDNLETVAWCKFWFRGIGFRKPMFETLLDKHGQQAISFVKHNPFALLSYKGAGIESCDKLFLKLGGRPDCIHRLTAWLQHRIGKSHSTWFDKSDLRELIKNLHGPSSKVQPVIDQLVQESFLVQRGEWYTRDIYDIYEWQIAMAIRRLNNQPSVWPALSRISSLTNHQIEAIETATSKNVGCLVGPGGTGKSTCTAELARSLLRKGRRVQGVASTGRAALRLAHLVNREIETSTVHMLLKSYWNGSDYVFRHNQDNPIRGVDFVIVDEASMTDLKTAAGLMDAIPQKTGLLFVGDNFQLPSVDKGNLLRDLVACKLVPTGRLEQIHRNAGAIAETADKIRRRQPFATPRLRDKENIEGMRDNFRCIPGKIREVGKALTELFRKLIAGGYSERDVQVISGTNRVRVGLNETLQQVFNPVGKPIGKKQKFRIGDRIIRTANNETVNGIYLAKGQIAYISSFTKLKTGWGISAKERYGVELELMDHDMSIEIEIDQIEREWELAYAITTHKMQGNQSPVCVMVTSEGDRFFDFQWVYTGISRAQSLCFVVGNIDEFKKAARREHSINAKTLLQEKIDGDVTEE